MTRDAVYRLLAILCIMTLSYVAVWQMRQLETIRAELAYRTAAWEECNVELEGGRD